MKTYHVITAKLVARTALHAGSGEGRDLTDDLCHRNAQGEFILPGTGICGALRAIATRIAPRLGAKPCDVLSNDKSGNKKENQPCGCLVCQLFGDTNPTEGTTEKQGGRASRLIVAHAKAVMPDRRTARIRDGVGIDRASRTSARSGSVKFDLEVLPKGTEFRLRFELEDWGPDQDQKYGPLLSAILAEWKAGRAWLGGRVRRGLGAFDLTDVSAATCDLTSDDGLMDFLKSDVPWEINVSGSDDWINKHLIPVKIKPLLSEDLKSVNSYVSAGFVTARFDLQLMELFLSNDTTAAARSGFDHAPLLDMISKTGKPILTGASLRGAIRAHAERIVRTLSTLESNNAEQFLAKFLACNPVESGSDEDQGAPLENCDSRLRKAAKKFPAQNPTAIENPYADESEIKDYLCLSCRLFGSTRRGSRLIVEDSIAAEPLEKKNDHGESQWQGKVLDFLAIDRFTGGGREGAKFDALAAWRPVFSVRLHLENPKAWELGWLALVLRDMRDEMVTVGFGAAKGFGRAILQNLKVDYGFLDENDFCGPVEKAASVTERTSGLYRLLKWDTQDDAQRNELFNLAEDWVKQFNQVREAFACVAEMRPTVDTYFTGDLPNLYPKEADLWQAT